MEKLEKKIKIDGKEYTVKIYDSECQDSDNRDLTVLIFDGDKEVYKSEQVYFYGDSIDYISAASYAVEEYLTDLRSVKAREEAKKKFAEWDGVIS